ncbi:Amino Acid-Polyamine-Organocation (APC) Family [Thraustotheca clavata]|uniref:Amino Acid-Polyamine-Organocation (APC) Family n=1 Tax=Thraustotheca clavata TaxID=74557 RepID=A0A1W0A5I8_9STRA|nr:Amino Acid-Polyamine-Organocation (APC) Family [Thraustotheca clavata]
MEHKDSQVEHERFARVPHLWALGTGTVVAGSFFGWQAGLSAGFLGFVINLSIATVFYMLLLFSIAEMSTAIPCGGGPYIFAERAWGPTGGYFAGIAEALKIVVTVAAGSSANAAYMNSVLDLSSAWSPIWWIVFCFIFFLLNVGGVALTFNAQVATTAASLLFLIIFYIGSISHIDYDKWVVAQDWEYQGGALGMFSGFSFVMWFYLGVEELPLAVEEAVNPTKDMPKGIILSFATVVVLAFSTLCCSSMMSPGASGVLNALAPLFEAYKTIFGDTATVRGLCVLLVIGLLSSFHSFIYCSGRLLFAMARAGILPSALAKLHPTRQTPYVALGFVTGFAVFADVVLHYTIGDDVLTSVLINLSLIGALVSYAFQISSFIRLRLKAPDMERPYRSPFGMPGAILCFLMVFAILSSIIYQGSQSTNFLISVIVAIVYFVVAGVIYFWRIKGKQNVTEESLQDNLVSPGAVDEA